MTDPVRNPKVTTIEDDHGGTPDRIMQGSELARALAADRTGLRTDQNPAETPQDYGVASWLLERGLSQDRWNAALKTNDHAIQARVIEEGMSRALQQVREALPGIQRQTASEPHLQPRLQSIAGVLQKFDSVKISPAEVASLRPFLPGAPAIRTARAPGE